MPKFFITNQEINEDKIKISGNDINHIKNVLRKKVGDTLNICNTDTLEDYLCEITKLENKTFFTGNIQSEVYNLIPKSTKAIDIMKKEHLI